MSPYQHGEVYVTDDGAETDLDLGHYERFTGVSARRSRQRHHGPHLFDRDRARAPRRISRRHGAGDPACHRRDQGIHPGRPRRRGFRAGARSAARSATSRACRSSRRSASSATNSGASARCMSISDLVPYIPSARRAQDQADAAFGQGAAERSASSPTSCCAAATAPIPDRRAQEDRAVLQSARSRASSRRSTSTRSTRCRAPITPKASTARCAAISGSTRVGARPDALARHRHAHPQARGQGHDRHRRQIHASPRQLQVAGRGAGPWRHRQQRAGRSRLARQRDLRAEGRGAAPRRRARHPRAGRLRRTRHRGQDRGGAFRARAQRAVFRHLLRHADGGDRGGAPSRRLERRRLDRVRPVRRSGGRPDDRMDARQPAGAAQRQRRHGRHDAARRLRGGAGRRAAASPRSTARRAISERHRHRYEVNINYKDAARSSRPALFRHVARRRPARDRRNSRPSAGSSACSIIPS